LQAAEVVALLVVEGVVRVDFALAQVYL